LTDALNCRFGEKEALRVMGLGPWTVHDSLMVDRDGTRLCSVEEGISSSRYAEPFAAGTRPVFKTVFGQLESRSPAHMPTDFAKLILFAVPVRPNV